MAHFSQLSLFDEAPAEIRTRPDAATDPAAWFRDWARANLAKPGAEARASSMEVYGAMWGRFCAHLRERAGVDPLHAGPDEADDFMRSVAGQARVEHHARYARVLGKAYKALAADSPALAAVAPRFLASPSPGLSNEPTTFLARAERAALYALMAEPSDTQSKAGKVAARSKAMCALMLGAGLKPGEVTALRSASVNCAYPGDPVAVSSPPSRRGFPARAAELDSRAWPALEAWIRWAAAGPEGLLFPSEASPERPVDYATAFVGVKILLAQAQIGAPPSRSAQRRRKSLAEGPEEPTRPRASPQTLRNSFGAELLERGASLEVVCAAMGFTRLSFAKRFQAAHDEWSQGLRDCAPG